RRHGAALSPQFQYASLRRARPGLCEHVRRATTLRAVSRCYLAHNALRIARREDRDRAATPPAGDFRAEHAALGTRGPDPLDDGVGGGAAQAAGTVALV